MARGILEIDGRRIELTDEQVEELLKGKEKETFKRLDKNLQQRYYYISAEGQVKDTQDDGTLGDDRLFNTANYCTDRKLMQQRALHEILDRLLWRFSMENDGDKIDWNNHFSSKYFIYFDYKNKKFAVVDYSYCKHGEICFHSGKIAERAIKEIVEPFMKKHPEFVW